MSLGAGTTGPRGTAQTRALCPLQHTEAVQAGFFFVCFFTLLASFSWLGVLAKLTFGLFRHHAGVVVEVSHHFVKHATCGRAARATTIERSTTVWSEP